MNTSDTRSIAVVPHLMGFRPIDTVVVSALVPWCDQYNSPKCVIGPFLVCPLDDGKIPHEFGSPLLNFILDHDVRSLYLDWFGKDLTTMIEATDTHESILEILDEVVGRLASRGYKAPTVEVKLTDYENWIFLSSVRPGTSLRELSKRGELGSYLESEATSEATEFIYQGSAPALEWNPTDATRLDSTQVEEAYLAFERAKSMGVKAAVDLWRSAAAQFSDTKSLPNELVGRLNFTLTDPRVRDAVIVFALDSRLENLRFLSRREVDRRLIEIGDIRPNSTRIDATLELLVYCARRSVPGDGLAFAMCGYLCWWYGDGLRGRLFTVAALNSDSATSLANLIDRAYSRQLPPPWCDAQPA